MTTLGFILTVIFVLLKAFGVVAFSWLTVFLPLMIGAGIDVVIFVLVFLGGLVGATRGLKR